MYVQMQLQYIGISGLGHALLYPSIKHGDASVDIGTVGCAESGAIGDNADLLKGVAVSHDQRSARITLN